MGWLIEQFFDEVASAVARRIYRRAGWAGCVGVTALAILMTALIAWLTIILIN